MPPGSDAERIARATLAEDGETDITTSLTVPSDIEAGGFLETRSGGILAGTAYADAVAEACECTIRWAAADGEAMQAGFRLATVGGRLGGILRAERPLLNLLQRASGIATATRAFVNAVEGTSCRILHTRKTAPGLRPLDISGVLAGGGARHRADLGHEVMVKDNHWRVLVRQGARLDGVLAEAKRRGVTELYVEVESLDQLEAACAAGATRLLIDNQSAGTLRKWAEIARQRAPRIEIEATGGITLKNVRAYAEAGADFISIGALTHSVQAADIALEIEF